MYKISKNQLKENLENMMNRPATNKEIDTTIKELVFKFLPPHLKRE